MFQIELDFAGVSACRTARGHAHASIWKHVMKTWLQCPILLLEPKRDHDEKK
jgi:hypothetical protein